MRFLIITLYFEPEAGATPGRLKAFCEQLQSKGHEVEIITSIPNYPKGSFFEGYPPKVHSLEEKDFGIIHRMWLYPSMGSGLKRLFNYLTFFFTSIFGLFFCKKPDYLFIEAKPLLLAIPGIVYSYFVNTKSIINISDLQFVVAEKLGIIKNKFLLKFLKKVEGIILNKSDYITAVTKGIQEYYLNREDVNKNNILILPNGIDIETYNPRKKKNKELLSELGIKEQNYFLYAGTHGYLHGLKCLLKTADLLSGESFKILLVGDGSEKKELKELAKQLELKNVIFCDPLPPDDIASLYKTAVAGLSILRKTELADHIRPAKIFAIMAMQKPVIYAGYGEGAEIIKSANSGIVVEPENPRALKNAILKVKKEKKISEKLGANGLKYIQENFLWSQLVGSWEKKLLNTLN